MVYVPIIVALALALFGIFAAYAPGWLRPWLVAAIIICLFLGTGVQIYLVRSRTKKERQAKWTGKLRSPSKSNEEFPIVELGKSRLVWKGEPDKPIFDLAGEPLFLRLADGEALLSVVIRDEHGAVLATISDNEWFVAPSKALDRNFNENSLEVVDFKGDIVFQVQLDGAHARLAGRFYSKEGGPVFIEPWLHAVQGRRGSLFKYPSSEHYGELSPKFGDKV